MKTCRCCKFQFEKGKECPKCGFNMIQTFDDEAEREELKLAEEHRERLIDLIKDIQVVSYKYKVSAGKPILNETNYVDIALTARECYGQIVWSDEQFAPNPSKKKGTRSLSVQYSVDGADKTIKVDIPVENFDDMWSLGVMISEEFTVQFFLGNSENYTQSEKYSLELK